MLFHLLGRMKARISGRGSNSLPVSLRDLPKDVVAGSWQATYRETDQSLIFSGKFEEGAERVFLMFKGRLLGVATTEAGKFRFLFQKVGRKKLPPGARFEIATDTGVLAHSSGFKSWTVFEQLISSTDRFLDLDAQIDAGCRLTKKGTIAPREITEIKRKRYCALVAQIDDWFLQNTERPTLVSHGTLLGLRRDGDLIPYDDDFDCLYLSSHDDVASVAQERTQIAIGLVRAGFKCRLGRSGHIKIRNKYVEVDLMPAWIEDDTLFVSCYSQIPGASRFVLPPSAIEWGEYGKLNTFAQPEIFLEAQYGPHWRSPDPGYRWLLTPRGKRNRKLLAPGEQARAAFREAVEAMQ